MVSEDGTPSIHELRLAVRLERGEHVMVMAEMRNGEHTPQQVAGGFEVQDRKHWVRAIVRNLFVSSYEDDE